MVETSVINFFYALNPSVKSLCLAVSGGSDSIALLHLLYRQATIIGLPKLSVAHINHGLRGKESDEEELFVKSLCTKYGIRFHQKRLHGKTSSDSGIEAWARDARYAFFKRLRNTYGYEYFATGHTADDQAETIIMRTIRGSGLSGLRGIVSHRKDGILRPLTECTHKELQQWLHKKHLKWYEDSSNNSKRFLRNRIRLELLPMLKKKIPNITTILCDVAKTTNSFYEIHNVLINKWIDKAVVRNVDSEFAVNKELIKTDRFTASESFVQIFKKNSIMLEKKHLDLIFTCCNKTSGIFLLPNGWKIFPSKELLFFECFLDTNVTQSSPEIILSIPGTKKYAGFGSFYAQQLIGTINECIFDRLNLELWLDADKIHGNLIIRNANESDIFTPLGKTYSNNLMGYLKKQGFNSYCRKKQLVITDETDTIIVLVGVALCENVRCTTSTHRLLHISCRKHR